MSAPQIGFKTSDFDEDTLRFASDSGFEILEIKTWQGHDFSKLLFAHNGRESIRDMLREFNLSISAIAFYENQLDPDLKKRKSINEYLIELMKAASELDIEILAIGSGGIPETTIEENLPIFKQVFTPIVGKAEELGIKMAIENCTKTEHFRFGGENFAFCPYAWDNIFELIQSKVLGLEMDPSHLFWQKIDCVQAIYDYRDRIYSVHAKDTEIIESELAKKGIYGKDWHRFRLPGRGGIDWNKFFTALCEIGYEGGIIIEQEDPFFQGSEFRNGLILGLKYIRQYI